MCLEGKSPIPSAFTQRFAGKCILHESRCVTLQELAQTMNEITHETDEKIAVLQAETAQLRNRYFLPPLHKAL